MIPQSIVNAVEIFYRQGVRNAVLSPGSRSAPLTIAFARHQRIECLVVPDERSAGFIALGLAQATGQPAVVVTTSGTAMLNLAPALAEAFYRHIPLIAFTADRPPEWIDQADGQTIRQTNVFQNHIRASYILTAYDTHPDAIWHSGRIISEAFNCSKTPVPGPVHINVHIQEPFYPDPNDQLKPDEDLKIINRAITFHDLSAGKYDLYLQKLRSFEKVLIIAGQNQSDEALSSILTVFSNTTKIPVIGEITSNLNNRIRLADLIVNQKKGLTELKPDLLITFGGPVISKNIKTFIRQNKPREHWHITEYDYAPDTFQSLTEIIAIKPVVFFMHMVKRLTGVKQSQGEYVRLWKDQDMRMSYLIGTFLKDQPFGDWAAVKIVLEHLPKQTGLHLANSMSVRYASLSNPFNQNEFTAYSNRGTSGIDGCTSTAVGHAIADHRLQVLITGDQAFFYDRNALWQRHLPANLRIIIINNRGGGIFRLIDGPANLPELETNFEAGQFLTAERLAADHGLDYASCSNAQGLEVILKRFFAENPQPAILEVFTDPETNQRIFGKLMDLLSQQ